MLKSELKLTSLTELKLLGVSVHHDARSSLSFKITSPDYEHNVFERLDRLNSA